MAGRMGGERYTVQNLTIQAIDAENNLILVRARSPAPRARWCSSAPPRRRLKKGGAEVTHG